MEIYLARQPIFDAQKEVYGYEILYREDGKNQYAGADGSAASSNVLTRCFFDFGIEEMTGEKKAFINFTKDLLTVDVVRIFPKEYLVVEILETIEVDEKVIESCKELKKLGYSLVLDDFVFQPGYDALLPYVDIIKVDFLSTTDEDKRNYVQKYSQYKIKFLAEKVETHDDYEKALKWGYTYFQGYYFAKPEIGSRKKVVPYKQSYINLISALNAPTIDFNKIGNIIESDLGFAIEILRIVNTAFFSRHHKTTSVKQAIVRLGIKELKRWTYLWVLRDLKQDRPEELISLCMLRGKFLENICLKAKKPELSAVMLTLGMFSLIDVLTNKPMEDILKEMNFSDTINRILLQQSTSCFENLVYSIMLYYEKGQWLEMEELMRQIGLSRAGLKEAYIEAIQWIQKMRT